MDKDGNPVLIGKTIQDQINDYISERNIQHASNKMANNEELENFGDAPHI